MFLCYNVVNVGKNIVFVKFDNYIFVIRLTFMP